MDNNAEAVVIAGSWPLQPALAYMSRNPYLKRRNMNLRAYVDVFVDDFLGLSQGPVHRWSHVWRNLFHALDKVFQPLDS